MNKNLKLRVSIILAVLATSLYFTFPLDKRINLGLDLKGGMDIVLKVETEKLAEKVRDDAVLRAMEILRNRIDSMGVGETLIQRQGIDGIIVQLPGVTDREAAMEMIGKVAQLEFKLVNSDPAKFKDALAGNIPDGYELKTIKKEHETPILISKDVALNGEAIADARVDFDRSGFGEPKISLSLSSAGSKKFADLTKTHVGEQLAIVLDGEVLSAPNIREPILTGTAEISGSFTFEEASLLSLALRSGALPAPMHVEEERTIGPLLGQDSVNAGIQAMMWGGAILFTFMIFYYFFAGFVADIALVFNLLIILGLMGFLKAMMPASTVTLTLPGIAGIILTLGMAVDANVLINERIREEINAGRPLGMAIQTGYNRAFSAIFDSNLTSLIAAFFLFQFGSGPIKGFAVTLAMGLMASMFTALTVTHTIFDVLLNLKWLKSFPMQNYFKNTKIDFISKRYIAYVLSGVIIIAGIWALVTKGKTVYGIDFAGGQIQEYRFAKPVLAEDLRQTLKSVGLNDAVIQQIEKQPENVIIRTSEDTYDKVSKTLKEKMPDNPAEMLRIEKVGPVVGKLLRQKAILAITMALAAILIYVGFRFKHFDFAAAGVVALIHDVFVALGLLVFVGRQIDLLVVTALMTIAGYSINDTIVIYDRVRENIKKFPKLTLKDVINLSVNQTLGRTFLTSFATMIVVVALYFWGGEVLNNFAFCLIVGFVSGVYSTVFVVSPLALAWNKKQRNG